MLAKATLKLGGVSYQFDIEEKDELETLHKIIVLSNPRHKCICGNNDPEQFHFTTNKSSNDKGTFTYVNVKCNKCEARSKLGEYKAGGYFWHEFEKYSKPDNEQAKE